MTATTDIHSENQPQMHGTHYGGRSFPDVMQEMGRKLHFNSKVVRHNV